MAFRKVNDEANKILASNSVTVINLCSAITATKEKHQFLCENLWFLSVNDPPEIYQMVDSTMSAIKNYCEKLFYLLSRNSSRRSPLTLYSSNDALNQLCQYFRRFLALSNHICSTVQHLFAQFVALVCDYADAKDFYPAMSCHNHFRHC